ncbi:class I mannose-6-phosphate isomerase [Bacteroidota bacterium]|nr:class I mannose-6-phosphate isomerase [Bacteroidota bacterium]
MTKSVPFYPLSFKKKLIPKIWGGKKLENLFSYKSFEKNYGESWEVSVIKGFESVVNKGVFKNKKLDKLIEKYPIEILGAGVYNKYGLKFPLLIKFIDVNKPLSIQVHPNDEKARIRHNSYGKSEMWFIIETEKNANLSLGFNKKIDKNIFKENLNKKTIDTILNSFKVEPKDAFYVPAGTVHSLNGKMLLLEVQQSSDITYRIYDYERLDSITGKKRELHIKSAISSINFSENKNEKIKYQSHENKLNPIIENTFFKSYYLKINGRESQEIFMDSSFWILVCLEGSVTINYKTKKYLFKKGETFLIPAILKTINIRGCAEIIGVTA